MRQILTKGIVLTRTNFGEADRIITVITPDNGKLRLMAKGVRKERSKLAGGIELFSISQLSFIAGKRDIGTLVSTRLESHFTGIVANIERTMLGYELLKRLNKATEDAAEEEYFLLLKTALEGLNNPGLAPSLTEAWFNAQLLILSGHNPNLKTDSAGAKLTTDSKYNFDSEAMSFSSSPRGIYGADTIKLLRLLFGLDNPLLLLNVKDIDKVHAQAARLVNIMLTGHIRL